MISLKTISALGLFLSATFLFGDKGCSAGSFAEVLSDVDISAMMPSDDPTWIPTPQRYPMQVQDDILSIQLEVNLCTTRMVSPKRGEVSFVDRGCTEACCDSDYAIELLNILDAVESYDKIDDHYILIGPLGKVRLDPK